MVMTTQQPSADERRSQWVRSYPSIPGAYDEMWSAEQQLRPHWRLFSRRLDSLQPDEMARRWHHAEQLLHQNGVTYNVYGDPRGIERPWSLEPLPVLVDPEKWPELSQGVEQRARLLDAVLTDLYGPGRSLANGWIPPEIVFRHPSYLRPLHGVNMPHNRWIPLIAADLVRGPDGAYVVVQDRTQAPAGAGYALENRIVISSAWPEAFRQCNVARLTAFFRCLKDTLFTSAPQHRDNPRMVLITAGPGSATYFEQAYLAKTLDLTLVEGGDLAVRDDRVYLKTLGGLLPVDVILRRVDDVWLDPLELLPDSVLGVPGLVHVVRAGHVALLNPLGSGLAETPALMPYLPNLCRQLLGEEPILASVESFWCGEPNALDRLKSGLDELVVKSAFGGNSVPAIYGSTLSDAQREALLDRVGQDPGAFVAQRYIVPSTSPVLEDGMLGPRSLVLRLFAVAAGPRDYLAMSGGLALVAEQNEVGISMRRGARSKDMWVPSEDRVDTFSMVPQRSPPIELSRGGSDLPSRVADNLYWLGRYIERAESIARLARGIALRLGEMTSVSGLVGGGELVPLLSALKVQTELVQSAQLPRDPALDLGLCERGLWAAVSDTEHAGSLSGVIKRVLATGRVVRDRISTDTWRVLSGLDRHLASFAQFEGGHRMTGLVDLLNDVVVTLAAFGGLSIEGMTRGLAFHFLDMGRRVERAIGLAGTLRATLARSLYHESPLLEALLDVADCKMTYRRRYLASLQPAPVLDLLLSDETNPRSALYQISSLVEHIRALPPSASVAVRSPELRLALAVRAELELCDMQSLCTTDQAGDRPQLDALLEKIGGDLFRLSDALSESYLYHAAVSRHLGLDAALPLSEEGRVP